MKWLEAIKKILSRRKRKEVYKNLTPNLSMPLCTVCGERPSIGKNVVASSGIGIAVSNEYCHECLHHNAEPYDDLVGTLYATSSVDENGNLLTNVEAYFRKIEAKEKKADD